MAFFVQVNIVLLFFSSLASTARGAIHHVRRGRFASSIAAAEREEQQQTQRALSTPDVGAAQGFFDGSSSSGFSSASYDNGPLGSSFALQGFMFDYKDGQNHALDKVVVTPDIRGASVELSDGNAFRDTFSWKVTAVKLPSNAQTRTINGSGSRSVARTENQGCNESPVLVAFHLDYGDNQGHEYNELKIDLRRAESFTGGSCITMIRITMADSSYDDLFTYEIVYALVNDVYVEDSPGKKIQGTGAVNSADTYGTYDCSNQDCRGEPVLSGFHLKRTGVDFPIETLQVGVENWGIATGTGKTAAKGMVTYKDVNGGEGFDWFVRYTVVVNKEPSDLPYTLPTTTTTSSTTTSTTETTSSTTSTSQTTTSTTSLFDSDSVSSPSPPTPTPESAGNFPCGVAKYFLVVEYGDNPEETRVKVNPKIVDFGVGWKTGGTREEEITVEAGQSYVLVAKDKGKNGMPNGLAKVVQRVGIQNGIGQQGYIEQVIAQIDGASIGRQAKKRFTIPHCGI